jgi:hypothetical protein
MPPVVCDYTVFPTELVLHWHTTGGQASLSTAEGCAWTVGTRNEWVIVDTPSAGSGPAQIQFSNGAFTEEAVRRTPLEVRWPTPTAGQNVWISQEGCRYAITERDRAFPASGGQGSVFVFGDPISWSCPIGCPWAAVSNVPWIRVISSMPRAGDDLVTYQVEANPTSEARVGQIRVEHMTLTITQARP